jgi:hypothetical protein
MIIRQTISTLQGNLVVLTSAGAILEQRSAEGDPQRKVWAEVDMTGIDDARVVELVARPSGHDGQLVARLNDGRLMEQYQPTHRSSYGARQWRELAGPDGAP